MLKPFTGLDSLENLNGEQLTPKFVYLAFGVYPKQQRQVCWIESSKCLRFFAKSFCGLHLGRTRAKNGISIFLSSKTPQTLTIKSWRRFKIHPFKGVTAMIGWPFSKSEDDDSEQENRHSASSEEDCKEMEKKYGWELKRVEQNEDDSDLSVDCVFKGKQTSFWDMWGDHQDDPD